MSKRKNRAAGPNIPLETLERARRQAAVDRGEDVEAVEEIVDAPKVEAPKVQPVYRSTSATRAASTARRPATRSDVDKAVRKRDQLTQEEVARILENPTKEVSEAELREQYSYVLNDLRSMGILAAGLIAALVLLAQILPK